MDGTPASAAPAPGDVRVHQRGARHVVRHSGRFVAADTKRHGRGPAA